MPKKTKIIIAGSVIVVLLAIVVYVNMPKSGQAAPEDVMQAAIKNADETKVPEEYKGPPVVSKHKGMGGGR